MPVLGFAQKGSHCIDDHVILVRVLTIGDRLTNEILNVGWKCFTHGGLYHDPTAAGSDSRNEWINLHPKVGGSDPPGDTFHFCRPNSLFGEQFPRHKPGYGPLPTIFWSSRFANSASICKLGWHLGPQSRGSTAEHTPFRASPDYVELRIVAFEISIIEPFRNRDKMKRLNFLLIVTGVLTGHAWGQTGPGPIVYHVEGMDSVVITRDQIYHRVDGKDLQFDLYLPAGEAPASGWPIAVLFHGGP